MFKITSEPKFTHTVTAFVPTDGGHEPQSFKATFRVLTDKDAEDISVGDVEYLKRIVVGFDDIEGADGQPLPYSDALRDQLLALPYVRVALARTYVEAVSKSKAGN